MAFLHSARSFRQLTGREYKREDTTDVLAAAVAITARAGGRKKITRDAHSIDAGMDTFIWSSRSPFDRPAAAWKGRLPPPYSRVEWLTLFPDDFRRLVTAVELDEQLRLSVPG